MKESLLPCSMKEVQSEEGVFAAVLTKEEWKQTSMRGYTDLEEEISETKIDVNYDYMLGTFRVPELEDMSQTPSSFHLMIDEKKIVFIDDSGIVQQIFGRIAASKKWRNPCAERLLYDFLETLTASDMKYLQGYERRLNEAEKGIIEGDLDQSTVISVNDIRGELLDLRSWYEQLIGAVQELEENENEFFSEENLRYFHLFTTRAERLYNTVESLRDYSSQIRDLYQTQLDVRQNRILAVLTILTTIFFPLTIITGWYGMNFVYMPELQFRYAYPTVICICILIVVVQMIWFRKKKYW